MIKPSAQPVHTDKPRKTRASGRTTLSDVAHAAGVSTSTASRALRGERAVDPLLVAQVTAASDRLGYVPDPAARALASQRSDHVAILIPLLSNTLFVDLLEAAQKTLKAAGFQTLMGVTHYKADEEEQLLREQLLNRPAGLLVTGLDQNAATRALIARSQVPCVHMMDLPVPGPRLADAASPEGSGMHAHAVGFRQTEAGHAMTRYLLGQGHRRIAFAAAQLDPRVMQRLQGWRSAMQAAGVHEPRLEWLKSEPSSLALGGALFAQIMRECPQVEAIFFCNDDLAQGALLAAWRLGISVPNQVAVVGFNDLPGSEQMVPPLTTVRTPRARIGEAAAQMLLGLMNGEPDPQPWLDVGFELVLRESA